MQESSESSSLRWFFDTIHSEFTESIMELNFCFNEIEDSLIKIDQRSDEMNGNVKETNTKNLDPGTMGDNISHSLPETENNLNQPKEEINIMENKSYQARKQGLFRRVARKFGRRRGSEGNILID
mmetsp:Transcript_18599/g.21366  ORF Transcript_18599/g.21366 Transcript_18599/m.21366 type:complete len:125 (-) Transcript_18599:130-504(-)